MTCACGSRDTIMSIWCQLLMYNSFVNSLQFDGLFPCFCEFFRSSLISMLQEHEPRRTPLLKAEVRRFRGGNSNILNQGGKTKILSYVSCFYPKCLAKMKNKPFLRQCLLTIIVCGNFDHYP